VQLLDEKIIFTVHYPIEVRSKDGTVIAELREHTAESPVKLKRLQETAARIVEFEVNELRFEDLTIDLLSLEHEDVPMSGIALQCKQKTWERERVKQTLKDMLRVNIGKFKVKGTDYVEFPDSLPYYQHHYVWDILVDQKDIAVNFLFSDSFPFQFAVTPWPMQSSTLGGVKAQGMEFLPLFCLQTWKFTYDISYPVLVKLIDQTTGYIFHAAFTVHVRRNRGDRGADYLIRQPVMVDRFGDEQFCGSRRVPMTISTYKLIENRQTGVYAREPLEDVHIKFSCLRYGCDIGETKVDARVGPVAQYRGNFPYCAGGIVRGEKEGYKEATEWVVTAPEELVELDLVPVYQFPAGGISVVKHELNADGTVGPAEPLSDNELAAIRLFTNESVDDHEYRWAYAPGESSEELAGGIEFLGNADFTYQLEVQLFDGKEYIGGYQGDWLVDWETLESASAMVFHVVYQKSFADDAERFTFINNLNDYSAIVPLPELRVDGNQ
jgi:hypothetical protein